MAEHKHVSKFIIGITAVAVILCLLAVVYANQLVEVFGGTGVTMEYETKLFDTDEIISINIEMDEDDWNEMLENAMSEEYYVCDVVINGTRISNVAIRPKGNTSLSAIVSDPDSDRYSFKLEFDHFVEGQTCFGLDKLVLNNNYADATNMKEAIVYDMFRYLGADASLYNYAKVNVNGEYWGVYLALESVDESFMLRNFGTQDGELYKPESMGIGGNKDSSDAKGMNTPSGNMPQMGDFDPSNMPEPPEGFSDGNMPQMGDFDPSNMPEPPEGFSDGNMPQMGDFDPSEQPQGEEGAGGSKRPQMGGGPSMGGNGANLNYTDDELDSYSTIWDGSITGTSDKDHARVVKALKHISEGDDIEDYLDVDNILKYMAVHAFVVNMDSLSGNMAHNYYLYEYDGKLNLFPWDYNLSFGGMGAGKDNDASGVVNDAIDTPFGGTEFFDALLENEEYLAQYHAYLQQLADEYVEGGRFEEVYTRIRSQIDDLVAEDPTAFYGYEDYDVAAKILYEVVKLRAQSVAGQLAGTIPSTDEGQQADPSALIDASDIDVKAMGTFNMGGDDAGPRHEHASDKPGGMQPPAGFSGGMGGQQTSAFSVKNLIIMGSCFAGMLVALLIVWRMKRRKAF